MKNRSNTTRARGAGERDGARLVNEGQRLVLEVKGSLGDIADACGGVAKSLVSGWRSGAKRPGPELRERLHEAYGIPTDAWDRDPSGLESVPSAREVLDDIERGALPGTMDMVEEQIAMLRDEQLGGALSATERVRYADAMGRLLSRRSDMELAAADLVKFVLDHSDWARFWTELERKMRDRPDDLRDLVAVTKGWRFARD